MISKISANYGVNNNFQMKKTNSTTPLISQTINKQNSAENISFEGVSSILLKAGNLFRKSPETVEEAILLLEKRDFGAYIRNKEGKFVFYPVNQVLESGTKEAVVKQGTSESWIQEGDESTVHIYRLGISPSNLLASLKRGLEKVTMVADNGIQTLTFPRLPESRKAIQHTIETDPNCIVCRSAEQDCGFIMPLSRTQHLYQLAQNMIKGIEGVEL